MLGVQDFRLDSFRRNVLTIAGAAKMHNLPTVLTGSYVEGPNGPIMGELLEMFPDAPTILRPGPISAWEWTESRSLPPNGSGRRQRCDKIPRRTPGITLTVTLKFHCRPN